MSTKRCILFRFHTKFDVCVQRIVFLRSLNPSVEIHGLYGGKKKDWKKAQKTMSPLLDSNVCVEKLPTQRNGRSQCACMGNLTPKEFWQWKNGDLVVNEWFKQHGKHIEFDVLHVIEWDMLLFAPLHELYKHIPKNIVGLTGIQKISDIGTRWNWTVKKERFAEYSSLINFVTQKYNYKQQPVCCFNPGGCYPKSFLIDYVHCKPPALCNDEIRLPLFAQVLGYKIKDTKLKDIHYSIQSFQILNTDKVETPLEVMEEELRKKNGARAFHPYYKKLPKKIADTIGL